MKKLFLLACLLLISHYLRAQSNIVTISQAYGYGMKRAYYSVTYKQHGTEYFTVYKFGDFTITADNKRTDNVIIINIKTPGILGADDNITIPYNECNGYVMYKGGVVNLLGSNELEYLVSFRTTEKKFVSINQVMDNQTDRYHYSLDPLNKSLFTLSKKIWEKCSTNSTTQERASNDAIKNNFSLGSLRSFNGKNTQQSHFFGNAKVVKLLSDLMGADYTTFEDDFLTKAAGVKIEVTNNVLYISTFQLHWATNKAFLLIDLETNRPFLLWNSEKSLNIYGQKPLTNNTSNFIQQKLDKETDSLTPEDQKILKMILVKYGSENILSDKTTYNKVGVSEIPTSVDTQPQFKGGNEALANFLSNNIKYPETAKAKKTEGTVWLYFIVDENGAIINPEVLRGIGDGCDEEALRVIRLCPTWQPARVNNHPVKYRVTLPLNFTLR